MDEADLLFQLDGDADVMKYITLAMLVFSAFSFSEKKEIICELDGSFSVTYRDLSKTVISEGLDFFKNLATQTQQSIFLINKAKTNFDKNSSIS